MASALRFTAGRHLLLCVIGSIVLTICLGRHFRGGTISWRSVGGAEVEFYFKMGWTYGDGPGCTENKIGQFVSDPLLGATGSTLALKDSWKCIQGCPGKPNMETVGYYCMAASPQEKWEQGQRSFNYTFPNVGRFVVAYEGSAWMALEGGKGDGNWSLKTTVDLRTRSDTGRPNSSPIALSQPLYYMQLGCHHELRIPVLDPDKDNVRCRWAKNDECLSICNALPGASLNETTCTVTFDATSPKYVTDGYYAVALTIEDYPPNRITLDGTSGPIKTPSDRLSSVPIQFLIVTPSFNARCDQKPRFISPTPNEDSNVLVQAGDTLTVQMVVDNGNDASSKIEYIHVMGPVGLQQSSIMPYKSVPEAFYKSLTWDTREKDVGEHIVCSYASNNRGKTGDPRCFTIKIVSDACLSNPCQHGASCQSTLGVFICTCRPGYKGIFCQTNIDDCKSRPCMNGGSCNDQVNDFSCLCPAGYTDKTCSTDIDDCKSRPCMNGGSCKDQVNDFSCLCPAGYTDKTCSTNMDDCKSRPCLNGGSCKDQVNDFSCLCPAGYTDKTCSTNIDDCKSRPCMNGGSCKDQVNDFSCLCPAGYTDKTCSTNIDDCKSRPCMNGGSCKDQVNDFSCLCPAGYTDKTCSTNIDDCKSSPCQNNATCFDLVNDYSCVCLPGYSGKNCPTNIDDCSPNPCQNGATCHDQVNDYSCVCVAGYMDKNCSTDIDDCSPNPCQNVATCFDQVNDYSCVCVAGYMDKNCSTDIDDCIPKPCQNGATCLDLVNDYSCVCVAGYMDKNCSTDIDDCSSDPCQNGAICHDQVNDYSCACVAGYMDKNCSTDIDDCIPNPCLNGATCLDRVNNYSCVCVAGYMDKNCSTGVNFCQPDPCSNNGVCQNGFTGFTCMCADGWQGLTCNYRSMPPIGRKLTSGLCDSSQMKGGNKNWNDECCQTTEYSDCKCVVSPVSHIKEDSLMRELLSTLVGVPIGLGLSLLTYFLYFRCCGFRPNNAGHGACSYREKHPPTARTQNWVDDSMTPVETTRTENPHNKTPGGYVPRTRPSVDTLPSRDPSYNFLPTTHLVTKSDTTGGCETARNIYRASFNDHMLPSIAPKKSPDTYTSGTRDWSI